MTIICEAKATDVWPEKNEINFPGHQQQLPMFRSDVPVWKRYLTMSFIRRKYMFEHNYITYIPSLKKYCLIRKYFVHDWASLPHFLRFFTSADGVLSYGACPHDWGYRFKGLFLASEKGDPFVFISMTRNDLDVIFRERNDAATKLKAFNKLAYNVLDIAGESNYGQVDVNTVNWKAPF